jgi:hypothetical protein
MNTIYTWNCRTVDAYPTYETESDVVYNVHWILTANEEVEGVVYSASFNGTQPISLGEIGDFIPFADLTNEIVTGWVKSAMGEEQVEVLENGLSLDISNQINPTSVTLTIQDGTPTTTA